MLEIGNPGDFKDDLDMIKVHFTYWVIMKSNLLLSTVLDELPAEILAVVKNTEALAIHQDAWGKQGRRVLSTPPPEQWVGPESRPRSMAVPVEETTPTTPIVAT